MRITAWLAACVVVFAATSGGEVRAQASVTASYTVAQNPTKIVTGSLVTYDVNITNSPGPITGYKWQWFESSKSTEGVTCNSGWKTFTNYNQSTVTVFEPWPGAFLVKCTVRGYPESRFGPGIPEVSGVHTTPYIPMTRCAIPIRPSVIATGPT